jgi:hypothetical protein
VDVQDRLPLQQFPLENHMPTYQIHTIASAPEKSKPALEQSQQAFGVIPNLAAVIRNSLKLVNSLVGVHSSTMHSN